MLISRLSGQAARSRCFLLVLLVCCFGDSATRLGAAPRQSGGKLSRVRSQVREKQADDHDQHSSHRSGRGRSHAHPVIGLHVYEEPCWVTYGEVPPTVADELEPVGPNYFASLPYANPWSGPLAPTTKIWTARTWFEHGLETDNVQRWGASVLIEEAGGWGLDGNWNVYTEDLAAGESDSLRIGDLNLVYRLVDTEHTQWRAGIGVNWLEDTLQSDYGINFTLGVDVYPVRPWVISTEIDWGTLGDTDTLHTRATVGASWDRLEVFGGYDYRQIGTISLAGPMVGLRVRF